MDLLSDGSLGAIALSILVFSLLLAFGFEFVNGFHDTANAVATVIYTHSLTPNQAVVWSGLWNFVGVATSSGAVAFAIVSLLPVELILHVRTGASFAMVLALLISAMMWNVGTWYLGLPASSSHTLIGSIVGVGLMNSLLSGGGFGEGVNWGKVSETIAALLTSPLIGFVGAAALMAVLRLLVRNPVLFRAPEGAAPPPWGVRSVLLLTCTGVSFAHGSNDGQKGMGLIMLVLIGLAPATFALHLPLAADKLHAIVLASQAARPIFERGPAKDVAALDEEAADRDLSRFLTSGVPDDGTFPALALKNADVATTLGGIAAVNELSAAERSRLRRDIYLVDAATVKLVAGGYVGGAEIATLNALRAQYMPLTNYIPLWVKLAVAVTLGLGTMIGWKRIVRTVGEKIGQSHLTYAQGASAETVAMLTISAADAAGLPVSTTHILSSGVAGAMFASHSSLQTTTLRNILLAWVLTLPACMLLGSLLFAAMLYAFLRILG
jgi:PiT family inorganic phosphate transporter